MTDVPKASFLTHFVFDLDGTLTDTWPLALRAFKNAIRGSMGREPSDAELVALAGPSEDGILRALVPDDWEACFARYLDGFREEIGDCELLFPGVAELLAELDRRGKVMAVNSGKAQSLVDLVLAHTGTAHFFAAVEGGSPEGDVKAERLNNFLKIFDVEREQLAYVGDSSDDIRAALKAHVLPIGAAWDDERSADRLREAGAAVVFRCPLSLRNWIADG